MFVLVISDGLNCSFSK